MWFMPRKAKDQYVALAPLEAAGVPAHKGTREERTGPSKALWIMPPALPELNLPYYRRRQK